MCHYAQTLPVGSPEHQTLLRWLAPGLLSAIDPLAATPSRPPASISVRTYYGQVEVTAAGPESKRWQVGQSVLAVLAIIVAVVCGVLCVLQLRSRQQAADEAKQAVEHAHHQVDDGVQRAKQSDAAALESAQERVRLADHLRHQLNGRLTAVQLGTS